MSLAPALLLSMPQLIDPNFARSVVLLCEHAPEGAFGLIVNRPSEISAAAAVKLEPPVLLRRVLTARPLPRRTHVLAGYAGWGPGQLDEELAQSAWLIVPVELDLIFEIPSAAVWEMAIRRLGADPHLLQMGHGVH